MTNYLIAIGVAIAALNSAWLMEGTSNNCTAVERYFVRAVLLKPDDAQKSDAESAGAKFGTSLVQGLFANSGGRLAARKAAETYPGVPTPIGCVIGYWRGRSNLAQ
jgi:hypothetical protein